MRALTLQNEAQKFLTFVILADFLANFHQFQIFVEQSIFVVQKGLIYEKAFIFDGKYDQIKIKRFA